MSTIRPNPQKPYIYTYNPNKFNSSSNYNDFGKVRGNFDEKNISKKCPKDNQKNNIQRTTHYRGQRKKQLICPTKIIRENEGFKQNNNIYPIKILSQNQGFNQNNNIYPVKILPQNQEFNQNVISTNNNYIKNHAQVPSIQQGNIKNYIINNNNQSLNNSNYNKKNSGRLPSHISARKIDNNINNINNINIITNIEKHQNNISNLQDENANIDMKPIYNKKNEEPKIKISHRNESVFTKATKNNFFYKVEKKGKYQNGAIGLTNLGNTCYFNAAIQNLKNIYLLTLYLLKHCSNFNINEFAYQYCELLSNLINQDIYQWYEPRKFFSKLTEKAPIFCFGQQNDSNYCVMYILTILEKETRIYINEKPFEKIQITNNIFKSEEKKNFF
jgi:hypothetical protein